MRAVFATDRKGELTLPSGPLLRRPTVVGSWLAAGAITSAFLCSDSAVAPKSFSPSRYISRRSFLSKERKVFSSRYEHYEKEKGTDVRH